MKKTYSKPEVTFENFAMATNIAGSCEFDTNVQSQNSCGFNFTGLGNVFMTGMNGCGDWPVTGWGDGNDAYADIAGVRICYHVPGGQNLFNS